MFCEFSEDDLLRLNSHLIRRSCHLKEVKETYETNLEWYKPSQSTIDYLIEQIKDATRLSESIQSRLDEFYKECPDLPF